MFLAATPRSVGCPHYAGASALSPASALRRGHQRAATPVGAQGPPEEVGRAEAAVPAGQERRCAFKTPQCLLRGAVCYSGPTDRFARRNLAVGLLPSEPVPKSVGSALLQRVFLETERLCLQKSLVYHLTEGVSPRRSSSCGLNCGVTQPSCS